MFEENDSKIQKIKEEYESGKLLSGELKKILIEKVQEKVLFHQNLKEKAKSENILDKYMYSGKLAKEMWKKEF